MANKKPIVTVNEAKLVWIDARLIAAGEALRVVERRLPTERQGRVRKTTMRKVWAIARSLEILSGELDQLLGDLQVGTGWSPALRSEVRAWMH
jgi:hypothetical protein